MASEDSIIGTNVPLKNISLEGESDSWLVGSARSLQLEADVSLKSNSPSSPSPPPPSKSESAEESPFLCPSSLLSSSPTSPTANSKSKKVSLSSAGVPSSSSVEGSGVALSSRKAEMTMVEKMK
ncbi:unnamed protein product [Linum trigynum]|uniref:Uncharacterized protein n=1 Tax=Linum trigynum TaxID=586398 RepID=A0AAV2EU77_9ROSI